MAYQMAATAGTLNDLEGHSPVASLFKSNPSNICVAFYTISTDSALARYLCFSRASCFVYFSLDVARQTKLAVRQFLIQTPCLKKTVQNCFCQKFVTFLLILIMFGRKMANRLKLCKMHSFSVSNNSRHHTTTLNVNVPNCYITL